MAHKIRDKVCDSIVAHYTILTQKYLMSQIGYSFFYLGQFCHYFWKASMSDWILLLYVDVIVHAWSKFNADLAILGQ